MTQNNQPDVGANSAQLSRGALAAIAKFYADSGVDLALDESPHNRLVAQAEKQAAQNLAPDNVNKFQPPQKFSQQQAAPQKAAMTHDDDGLPTAHAERLALIKAKVAQTKSLPDLHTLMTTLPFCALAKTASHCLTGVGAVGAQVMVVCLHPESEEDRSGQAFVGPEADLLAAMLRAIGLDLATCFATYLIPWRPPGRREPSKPELELCLPFLMRAIALVRPKFVLALGEVVTHALIDSQQGIGKPVSFRTRQGKGFALDVIPQNKADAQEPLAPQGFALYAPDRLIAQPLLKREAWQGLLALKGLMEKS